MPELGGLARGEWLPGSWLRPPKPLSSSQAHQVYDTCTFPNDSVRSLLLFSSLRCFALTRKLSLFILFPLTFLTLILEIYLPNRALTNEFQLRK